MMMKRLILLAAAALAPLVSGDLVELTTGDDHEGRKGPSQVNVVSSTSIRSLAHFPWSPEHFPNSKQDWVNPGWWTTSVTASPSFAPSQSISNQPSHAPTETTSIPSRAPSKQPSLRPSLSVLPTATPSLSPSALPSSTPTTLTSSQPSLAMSGTPSSTPSSVPSDLGGRVESPGPSVVGAPVWTWPDFRSPSAAPSPLPSNLPTVSPSTTEDSEDDFDYVTCNNALPSEQEDLRVQVRFFYNIRVETGASVSSILGDIERNLLPVVALALLECDDEDDGERRRHLLAGVLGVSSGPNDEVVGSCDGDSDNEDNECYEIAGRMTVRSSTALVVTELSCTLTEAIRNQTNLQISGLDLFTFTGAELPCPDQEDDTDAIDNGGIGQEGDGDSLGNQSETVNLGTAIGIGAGAMVLLVAVLMFARGRHRHVHDQEGQKLDDDGHSILPTPRTLEDHFDFSSPVKLSSSSSSSDSYPSDEDYGALGAEPSPWRKKAGDIEELADMEELERDDTALLLSEQDSKKGPIRGKRNPMSAPAWARRLKKVKNKNDRYYQSCLETTPPMAAIKEQNDEGSCSSSDCEALSEVQSEDSDFLSAQGDWEGSAQNSSEAESPKSDLDDRIHTITASSPVVRLLETPPVPLKWRGVAPKPTSEQEEAQTTGEVLQLNLEGDVVRLDRRKMDDLSWEEII